MITKLWNKIKAFFEGSNVPNGTYTPSPPLIKPPESYFYPNVRKVKKSNSKIATKKIAKQHKEVTNNHYSQNSAIDTSPDLLTTMVIASAFTSDSSDSTTPSSSFDGGGGSFGGGGASSSWGDSGSSGGDSGGGGDCGGGGGD